MNAGREETPGYFYDALFVIGMVRHVVGKRLDVLWCVGHGDACPGVTQHADIIITVAAADDVCRGNAQEMEEFFQTKGFIDAARRHFQAQRLGMIDFSPSQIELGQEGIEGLEQIGRPRQQTLVNLLRCMAQEIAMPDDGQLAPFRFPQHVRIGTGPGDDPSFAIGHDAQAMPAGVVPQRPQRISRQTLFVQAFPGLIFDDGSTVKGDDITTETVEAQCLGNGIDPFRRPARRQDKLHALFL